jgi:release factor glutamine methyltransferase
VSHTSRRAEPTSIWDREVAQLAERLRAAGCVYAEDEAILLLQETDDPDRLEGMTLRRLEGWPLEQVLGRAELCGVRVHVCDGVFVPRRRSELLVREAVAVASRASGRAVLLDLCCGTGAVGVAVATLHGDAELHASDLDPGSVSCAGRHVEGVGGAVYLGDLYDPLPNSLRRRVDVLVANAPYVPTDELAFMPVEAREHEPRIALDGGADGVAIQRRIVAGARQWLSPRGQLLVETSLRQVPLTVAAFEAAGFAVRVASDDDLEASVVVGS